MSSYDVVVIGSGPGGYVSAIRCAQLGMKTALVEKYQTLGGTCLNVGCIPSKALLDSSEHYHAAVHSFEEHGIQVDKPQIDFAQMMNRKAGVVNTTCDGIDYLMKKNEIDVLKGFGSLLDKNTVQVSGKVLPRFLLRILFSLLAQNLSNCLLQNLIRNVSSPQQKHLV